MQKRKEAYKSHNVQLKQMLCHYNTLYQIFVVFDKYHLLMTMILKQYFR